MTAAQLSGPPRQVGSAARSAETWLRLVPPQPARAARAARAPFVLLVFGLLAMGLLALLLLNTALAQGAFRLHDLQRSGLLLADRQQQLDSVLTRHRSPLVLAGRARTLGMVPAGAARYVRLADGRVVALLTAAPVQPAPPPVARTGPATGANPGAKPGVKPGAKPSGRPRPVPPRTPTPTASPR